MLVSAAIVVSLPRDLACLLAASNSSSCVLPMAITVSSPKQDASHHQHDFDATQEFCDWTISVHVCLTNLTPSILQGAPQAERGNAIHRFLVKKKAVNVYRICHPHIPHLSGLSQKQHPRKRAMPISSGLNK